MDLPVVGGFGVAALVIVFRLLTERSEIRDLKEQVTEMNKKIAVLEASDAAHRGEKHRLDTELAKATLRLGVFLGAAERCIAKCTCGAYEILADLLADPRANPLGGDT